MPSQNEADVQHRIMMAAHKLAVCLTAIDAANEVLPRDTPALFNGRDMEEAYYGAADGIREAISSLNAIIVDM